MLVRKLKFNNPSSDSCDLLSDSMNANQNKESCFALLSVKYGSGKHQDSFLEILAGISYNDLGKLTCKYGVGEQKNLIKSKLNEADELRGDIFNG